MFDGGRWSADGGLLDGLLWLLVALMWGFRILFAGDDFAIGWLRRRRGFARRPDPIVDHGPVA